MRCLVSVLLLFPLAACGLDRDLSEDRFACTQGGSCGDAGESADAGETKDGGTVDAGAELCDETFNIGRACGGDPVGAWSLSGVCGVGLVEALLQETCSGAIVTRMTVTGLGRITFQSNDTYSASQALTIDADYVMPTTCNGFTCTYHATIVQAATGGRAECVVGATQCDCLFMGTLPVQQSGAFEKDTGRLTLSPDTNEERVLHYCVEGDVLTYEHQGTVFVSER